MGNFLNNPLVALFLGLVLGALAVSGKFSVLAANILLLFALGIGSFGIVNAGLQDYRLTFSGMFGLAIGCLLLSYWITPNTAKRRVADGTSTAVSQTKFDLHQLFRDDFTTGSYKMIEGFTQNFTKGNVNLGAHYFEVGLYGDFAAKCLFMSLYLPGDKDAYDIIAWFADGYEFYLRDARKTFHLWTAPQGDQSQPLSDNLVFTNKMYVYYENILPDDQVHALESLYRQKGLEPTFRGFGYLEFRRIQAIADPKTAPKGPSKPTVKGPPLSSLPPLDLSPLTKPPKVPNK